MSRGAASGSTEHQPVPAPPAPGQREPGPRGIRALLARAWWVVGLAIAAVVVVLAASFASSDPDGLERVAEDQGFIDAAQGASYEVIPDYAVPGIDGTTSTIAAGVIGIAVVFIVVLVAGRVLARRRAAEATGSVADTRAEGQAPRA